MKKIYFALLSLTIISNSNIIDGEINIGNDVTFGLEGLSPFNSQVKPILKLVLPHTREDYHINYKTIETNNFSNNITSEKNEHYIPNISSLQRDLELSGRYLSKEIKIKNYLNLKLKENIFGFKLSSNIETPTNNYSNFFENLKVENANISLSLDNKYINGKLTYHILAKKENETALKNILDGKRENNKNDFEYDINTNIYIDNLVLKNNISGVNKDISLQTRLGVKKENSYFDFGIMFEDNPKLDIENEFSKIKYIAPGNSKIEYFKNFNMVNKKINTIEEYDNDLVNLERAEISGYKGTWRLNNLPSGSLYGDNPIKFTSNEIIDEIYLNKNFKNLSEIIKRFEKDKTDLTLLDSIWLGILVPGIVREFKNKDAINDLIVKISDNILERLDFNYNSINNKYGIYKQIPEEFKYLIPYRNKDFDYTKINSYELDPNYLYNNGFKLDIKTNSNNTNDIVKDELRFDNSYRDITTDFNRYFVSSILKHNKLIDNIATGNYLNLASDFISDKDFTNNIRNLIERPENIKGFDLLRGIYFHSSEKEQNSYQLNKKIMKIISKKDFSKFKNNSNKFTFIFNYNLNKEKYNIDISARLFNIKRYEFESDKITKKENRLNFNFIYNDKNFNLISKNNFKESEIFSKIDNNIFNYQTLEFHLDNTMSYNFKYDKLNFLFGLNHTSDLGYIIPKKIIINGEEYKEKVAKRDKDNNPIDLLGNSVIVANETEKSLVDKAINSKLVDKEVRKILPRDFITSDEKKAISDWYKIKNLIVPFSSISYDISDNMNITGNVKIPIEFDRKKLDSVGILLNTNFKYKFSEDILSKIFLDEDPLNFKFKLDGKFNFSLFSTESKLKYNLFSDFNFISLKAKKDTLKNDLRLSFNPLIVDFKIKPNFSILNHRKDMYFQTSLNLSSNNSNLELGFMKPFRVNSNIFEKELIEEIRYILKTRNENEYNKFNEEINGEKFLYKLDYYLMPFINFNYDNDIFKFNLSYNSKKGKYINKDEKINKSVVYEKEQNLEELGDYNKSWIAWDYFNNRSNKYIYVVPREKEKKEIIEKNLNEEVKNENHSLDLEIKYGKEIGFNLESNLNLNFSVNSIVKNKEIIDSISKEKNLYVIYIEKYQKYKDLENQFIEEYKLKNFKDENLARNHLEEMLRKRHNRGIREMGSRTKNVINEMLKEASVTNNIKYIAEQLKNNTLELKHSISLGYNWQYEKSFIFGFNLINKLNLKYNFMDYGKYKKSEFYGENRLKLKNELSSLFNLKYKINNKVNIYTNGGINFEFDKKGYRKTSPLFEIGSELKW